MNQRFRRLWRQRSWDPVSPGSPRSNELPYRFERKSYSSNLSLQPMESERSVTIGIVRMLSFERCKINWSGRERIAVLRQRRQRQKWSELVAAMRHPLAGVAGTSRITAVLVGISNSQQIRLIQVGVPALSKDATATPTRARRGGWAFHPVVLVSSESRAALPGSLFPGSERPIAMNGPRPVRQRSPHPQTVPATQL